MCLAVHSHFGTSLRILMLQVSLRYGYPSMPFSASRSATYAMYLGINRSDSLIVSSIKYSYGYRSWMIVWTNFYTYGMYYFVLTRYLSTTGLYYVVSWPNVILLILLAYHLKLLVLMSSTSNGLFKIFRYLLHESYVSLLMTLFIRGVSSSSCWISLFTTFSRFMLSGLPAYSITPSWLTTQI